jgi:hypothetical protein
MTEPKLADKPLDSDIHKGATEDDQPGNKSGGTNMQDQLDHRSADEDVKDADSDFPEPGSSPEHSGQHS